VSPDILSRGRAPTPVFSQLAAVVFEGGVIGIDSSERVDDCHAIPPDDSVQLSALKTWTFDSDRTTAHSIRPIMSLQQEDCHGRKHGCD